MTDLYLIAHKVRGEPAFDVAQRIDCPECNAMGCNECDELGYWWVVPTSGHRAYPYWHTELIGTLQSAFDEQYIIKGQPGLVYDGDAHIREMPDGLQDHYACNDRTTTHRPLFDLLNLRPSPPTKPFPRRI